MARKAEVIITCDATTVKQVLDGINREIAHTNQERQKLLDIQKRNGALTEDEKKQLKDLDKYLTALNDKEQKTAKTMKMFGEVMKDLSGAKLKDLKKALQEGKAALNNMSARDPGRDKLVHDLQRIQKQIEANTGALKSHGSAWQSAVKNITAYVGVFGAFNFVKNKISEVIRGGEELSDQMAQVRMVSGLAMEDIEDLTRTLAKMDTRTTLSELERIAYAGAKLGFGEYGTKGLEEFVRAANQVNVALREDLGEEALTALSKITENMGLIKKMGVEDAMLATSSAMFKLAATSTAAAGPIVEVTKRLVPVAQASGMATHEILALASASDSLQLMPEVVGTALSKLLMAMQNNHNLIEQTLGIDEGTIARMIKAGDVMDAMLMIFDRMSGKNMTELSGIWKLLGSDGQRLITVVQAMANHTDTLRKHLETSTQAFKEATAVTEEYNIQQETAAALMQRASNLWRNAMVNADTSLSVKEMAKSWYDFSKSVLDSEFSLSAIKVTIDALLLSIRLLINLLPMIAFGLMAKGAAMLAEKLLSAKMSVDGFTLSWKKMDAATKANWISLAIGLFAQLAFSVAQWAKSNEEAEASQKKLNDAINSAADKADQEINAMSRLKAQIEDTSLSQEERMKMFSKFKTDYDIYLNYLGIELKSVDELAKHYDALTKVMRQRFAYQEREDYKRDVMGGEEGLRMRRRTAGSDLTRIANDINQKVDLSVIDSYVASGIKPGEISQKILGKRPNVQMSIPTDKLRDAIVHYAQTRLDETLKEKQIDAAFAQEIGDFDYDRWLRTQVKGDFKLKPNKAAIAAAKKAADDAKAAARKELKDAETETNAIIAKIEEWYTLQQNVITESYNDGKITEQQMTSVNQQLEQAKNAALAAARRSLSGQDTQTWQKVKTDMDALMLDQGEWSRELLDAIVNTDMDALRNALMKFDGKKSLEQWGFTSTAFRDGLNKNAAKNEAKAREIDAKAKKQVETFLLQYDFINQAYKSFSDQLVNLGILTETAQQMAKKMADADNPEVLYSQQDFRADQQRQEQSRRDALTAFLKQGSRPYNVDMNNAGQLQDWLRELTGAEFDGIGAQGMELKFHSWAEAFRDDFTLWIKDADKYKTSIQEFFMSLMTAEDNYYKKRKEAYNNAKTHLDQSMQAAGWTDQYDEAQTELSGISSLRKITGDGENLWQQHGLQDTIAEDPEIKAIQLRIAMRQKEFEEAKALGESQQLIAEKQNEVLAAQADLAEQVGNSIANRISHLRELSAPLEEFGEDVGQKLGDALFGLQSTSDTWNQITKKMILSVSKMTVQMASQYLQQKLQQALTNKAIEAQEMMHQATMQSIAIAGGAARVAAEQVTNTQLLTATEIADRLRISKEARVAAIMAAFGISEGAAKTIAALGFWGIPLIGVITSVLMGLLSSALSTAGAESAGSSSSTAATPKTKLVSGMLTYDKGNVDKFAGRRKLYDDGETQVYGRRRYLGEDGKVYTATAEPAPKDGLVTHPIATTVQGQPALVAENGPEIVIGRETTKAIMMNEPELIKYLANYQQHGGSQGYSTARGLAAYDSGNVESVAVAQQPSDVSPQTSDAAAERQALINRLDRSDALMEQVLYFLQNPVAPEIAMYDTGGKKGLRSKMKEADRFMARYGG